MASKTFGGVLSIYDSAYKVIGGLLDVTWPSYKADEPLDVTSHSSASGVREYEAAGTKDHTDFSFECNDLPSDTGQVAVLAGIGASYKFKFVSAAGTTEYINAIIISFSPGPQPVNGKATRVCTAKATGVNPTS
ncbi:MAG: hypothetical protein WC378_15630 [Opitutaceae bacterium]|jgi:hypothetical protein